MATLPITTSFAEPFTSFLVDQAIPGPHQALTPAGYVVDIAIIYRPSEKAGVQVLIAASMISLISVVALLIILAIAAHRTIRSPNESRFMRTHVVAYFISLLFCDVISSLGSLLNIVWISGSGASLSPLCTAQGALKNAGNVGTAMWTTVIAIHTFSLLVLKWRSKDYILYVTLFVVWSFTGLVVIIGPAAVQDLNAKGPYFGISGYWCWITDSYPSQRITLEYLWMFLAVVFSAILYSAVFLSLRGNLIVDGRRIRFNWKINSTNLRQVKMQTNRGEMTQATNFAKHMLLYPIAYAILILPIAICRFTSWAGIDVPFAATIFAATVFLLSGFVNVILFTTTRRLIPGGSGFVTSLFSKQRINPSSGGSSNFLAEKGTSSFSSSGKFDLERQDSVNSMDFVPVTPYIVDSRNFYASVDDESLAEMASYTVRNLSKSPSPPLKLTIPPQAKLRANADGYTNELDKTRNQLPQTILETIPLTPPDAHSVSNALEHDKSTFSTHVSNGKKPSTHGISLTPTVASIYSQASIALELPNEPVPALPRSTERVAGPRMKPLMVRRSTTTANNDPGTRDTIGITDYYRYTAIMNSVAGTEAEEALPPLGLGDIPPASFPSGKESPSKLHKPAFALPYSSENPPPTLPRRSHERSNSNGKGSKRTSTSSYKVTPYPYEYDYGSRTSEESERSSDSNVKAFGESVGSGSVSVGHSRNRSGSIHSWYNS